MMVHGRALAFAMVMCLPNATGAAGTMPKTRLVLQATHVRKAQPQLGAPDRATAEQRESRYLSFWSQHADRPHAGRRMIVASVCSELSGLFDVKLALLLVLLGGVPTLNGTARTRGEPHMLLVGDPGTGKSQLMKFAAKLVPRYADIPTRHNS